MFRIEVGNRIRELRKEQNMSQETLADKSDLHPTYIGQVERGEKNASIECLHQIVKALQISMSEFFYGIENHVPQMLRTKEDDIADVVRRKLGNMKKQELLQLIIEVIDKSI